jgi:quercetin dioxygenase-like cupin family protein
MSEPRPLSEVLPDGAIRHHFAGQDDAKGVYAKEVHIPAGVFLVSHEHPYDHLSILAKGNVLIEIEGEARLLHAPAALLVEKHKHHTVHAITNAVWFCIHPTEETDHAKVDGVILSKGEV